MPQLIAHPNMLDLQAVGGGAASSCNGNFSDPHFIRSEVTFRADNVRTCEACGYHMPVVERARKVVSKHPRV